MTRLWQSLGKVFKSMLLIRIFGDKSESHHFRATISRATQDSLMSNLDPKSLGGEYCPLGMM